MKNYLENPISDELLDVVGEPPTWIMRGGASVMTGILPVSYTHLDVYKRQALGCRCNGFVLSRGRHANSKPFRYFRHSVLPHDDWRGVG